MSRADPRICAVSVVVCIASLSGCTSYKTVVKPTASLSLLSPELENLTDDAVETYLKASVRPVFPSRLAVAKVARAAPWFRTEPVPTQLEVLRGAEARGWRSLAGAGSGEHPVEQVQFIGPLMVGERPTLKSLRDAAALVHAPLLLVYIQDDNASSGYNPAAMAYWSFIGLFFVPGNSVGHYSACQAILLDTRSGCILATAEGEAKREEHVLLGAVEIASQRVERESRAAAIADLQAAIHETMQTLAQAGAAPP